VREPRIEVHDSQPIVTFNQSPIPNRSACAAPYVVGFYLATSV